MPRLLMQANESEIPLLHEFNGSAKDNGNTIEVSLFLHGKLFFCCFLQISSLWCSTDYSRCKISGRAASFLCGNDSCSKETFHYICCHGFKLAGLTLINYFYWFLNLCLLLSSNLSSFRCFIHHVFSKRYRIIFGRFRCILLVWLLSSVVSLYFSFLENKDPVSCNFHTALVSLFYLTLLLKWRFRINWFQVHC